MEVTMSNKIKGQIVAQTLYNLTILWEGHNESTYSKSHFAKLLAEGEIIKIGREGE